MKKLIFLCALVAFAGFALAEIPPVPNAGFESGMSGWASWGSGSGSGASGYKWASHWAYIETTGGVGGSQFMNLTTASQTNYCEYWGWGYNITWLSSMDDLDQAYPNDWYEIDAWAKDLTSASAKIEFKFEWLDASGRKSQDGGLVNSVSYFIPITTDWAYYSVWSQAPANAYGLRPCWANPDPGKEVGIDDVSYAVPEPMSIALLGLGGLFLRRRK